MDRQDERITFEFSSGSMLRRKMSEVRRAVEFGDAVALLFIAAFVRQYFWIISFAPLAWVLTVLVSALVWYFYVVTKEPVAERTPRRFWLIVGVPLLFIYAMRVAYPDVSFDVFNYRLLHAERSLRGTLFAPGDFFPSPAPYNSVPDIVTGICRSLLGYRLGTIANLLVMLWTAQIVEKFLRPYIERGWLRAVGVLLVVLAEHMLFEINNYMADLLALPLLLEATRLALGTGSKTSGSWLIPASEYRAGSTPDASHPYGRGQAMPLQKFSLPEEEAKQERIRMVRIALLLGASVAFKLTNVAMAIPVILVYAYFILRRRFLWRDLPVSLLLSLVAFAAPLVPFSLYIYAQTGSPVFPVFNGIFKSPYWPANSGWDRRWGAFELREVLAWPVLITFKPERLSELAVYSGRISFGFVVAFGGLLFARRDGRIGALSFMMILGALLWSASTGYIRYALFLELLAGILVVSLAASLAREAFPLPSPLKFAFVSLLSLSLVVQVWFACLYVSRAEWSMRWTLFENYRAFLSESKNLLRDQSLRKFLSAEDRRMFDGVDVWVESAIKTSGIEVMLNRRAPIIGVRTEEYFVNPESKEKFARAFAATSGKRVFTLCFAEDYNDALKTLKSRGLAAGRTQAVRIPYYSLHNQISMFFIEVVRADDRQLSSPPAKEGGNF